MLICPCRLSGSKLPNAQAVAKIREQRIGKAFRENISILIARWNVQNPNLTNRHYVTNKVNINLYVLRLLMQNWIRRHVNRIHVVTEDNDC